jgi:hypothetical protein
MAGDRNAMLAMVTARARDLKRDFIGNSGFGLKWQGGVDGLTQQLINSVKQVYFMQMRCAFAARQALPTGRERKATG